MSDRKAWAPEMGQSGDTGFDIGERRPTKTTADNRCGDRSPLLEADWRYIETTELDDLSAEDWTLLNRQRRPYYADEQARQALRFLSCSEHDRSFGYQINNYRHCLQTATMAHNAGEDEETVVVALLHDIGFVACPDSHGEFAASLLANYISEKNLWMLRHHAIFQQIHLAGVPDHGFDPDERERWRGHPFFEWTANFVDRYDQRAMCPHYDTAPLSFFEPMVQRLFARPARTLTVD
ncbi:HD domain-containing protein [Pelagibius litoralis]|uniref:HD domain-containing protein n=1 Tax=Pelagibius litoralis TaxID=374515 RepID=A0A967F2D1_9PROT|nr:HD domain-containing protein [Pelagibius litoralis]NIA71767.1 HD domain-containing protein [Pelagibius litoralis]